MPLVDEVSPEVAAIGALNTVLIRDGRTVGHNTDVTGFRAGVRRRAARTPTATGSCCSVPAAPAPRSRTRWPRSACGGCWSSTPTASAGRGAGGVAAADRRDEVELVPATPTGSRRRWRTSAGLVNASPMGMAAHPGSPVPAELLRPDLWVADIVYRPLATALLGAARRRGLHACSTAPGWPCTRPPTPSS